MTLLRKGSSCLQHSAFLAPLHSTQFSDAFSYNMFGQFYYKTRDTQENTCSWKTGHKILIPWIFSFYFLRSLIVWRFLGPPSSVEPWAAEVCFASSLFGESLMSFFCFVCLLLHLFFFLAYLHCVLTWSWPPSSLSFLLYHKILSQVKVSIMNYSHLPFYSMQFYMSHRMNVNSNFI